MVLQTMNKLSEIISLWSSDEHILERHLTLKSASATKTQQVIGKQLATCAEPMFQFSLCTHPHIIYVSRADYDIKDFLKTSYRWQDLKPMKDMLMQVNYKLKTECGTQSLHVSNISA